MAGRGRRRAGQIAAALLLLSVAVAACGGHSSGGGPVGSSPGAQIQGYLAVARDHVTFLRWTRTNGSLQGLVVGAYDYGDGTVSSTSGPFGGSIAGSSVTLTSAADSALSSIFAQTLTGTLGDGTLTLSYPTQDGPMATERLHAATVADYNRAVAALAVRLRTAAHAAATATATVLATYCQVENQSGNIIVVAKGPTRDRICRALIALGTRLHAARYTGTPGNYTWNCTIPYQGSSVRVFVGGDSVINADYSAADRACAAIRHGRLPRIHAP